MGKYRDNPWGSNPVSPTAFLSSSKAVTTARNDPGFLELQYMLNYLRAESQTNCLDLSN